MRRFHLARGLLFVSLLTSSGCWVLNELDNGSKLLDQHSGKAKAKAKEAEEEEATSQVVAKKGAIDAYFKQEEEDGTSKSFSPGEMSGDIVSCHIGKSVQFMTKTNCAPSMTVCVVACPKPPACPRPSTTLPS